MLWIGERRIRQQAVIVRILDQETVSGPDRSDQDGILACMAEPIDPSLADAEPAAFIELFEGTPDLPPVP